MFEKLKSRCRDECLNNMDVIGEHLKMDVEYFKVSLDNNDKSSMKKWAREFEHDLDDYRISLKVFRWML